MTLTISDRAVHTIKTDALVIGVVKTDDGPALAAGHGLPRAAASHLVTAMAALGTTGALDEVHRVTPVPGTTAGLVALTGLGAAGARTTSFPTETLRRAAGAALRAVPGAARVSLALPVATAEAVAAVAEGAALGSYEYAPINPSARTTRTRAVRSGSASKTTKGTAISVCAPRTRENSGAVKRAGILAAATAWTRDLVNTPPNMLYPETFAAAVRERVADSGAKVTVKVLDEKALAKGGFGGIVGVGQGSVNPPRIVTMSYAPARPRGSIALVGKGITFDSGGLNLKPAAGMLTMKCDMAGAAAVAGAVLAAAEVGVPYAVTGYLCLAENLPSGTAQRPSDVVTMRNGTTVEILDTDAEGRMVLADGICLASESTPDAIIDIATLTGAQVVALGTRVAGVMGNDDALRAQVCDAAGAAGEAVWPMPLPAEMRSKLDSPVADLAHKGDRWGGMLTAAIFLQEFVGSTEDAAIPWAHIDIAGPAFNDAAAYGHTPKGGTGFGVATLVRLVETLAAG